MAPLPEASAEPVGDLIVEGPGTDEVTVLPWPLLFRERVRGRLERSESYPWIVLFAALWGLFSVGFSITMLSIATKQIAEDFATSDNVTIWVITGPMLLGAIVTPAAGKLADLFGARRVYLLSMMSVAVLSAFAAASWSVGSLIAFRTLGGAIGAGTGPAAIALINRLFPRERRAQALGYWALVAAGGPVVGVVAGGPVVEAIGWRAIFVAQVPFTLMTVLACAAVFPETPRRRAPFDYIGAALLGSGTAAFVVALNRAPEPGWGWGHPLVLAGLVAAPVLITAFALYESRVQAPLIPIRYFARRSFAFPMANQFFVNFAYMGGFFLTPLLLQNEFGLSPSATGFVSITRPVVFAVAGPLAGWAATKVGERTNGVVGGLFLLGSMLLFATLTHDSPMLVVFVALALSGAGMGTTAPAMAAAIANTVDEHDLGVAGGAQQMISQIGVVVGTQLIFSTQTASQGSHAGAKAADTPMQVLELAYSRGYLVGAGAALLGIVAASFVRATTRGGRATGDASNATSGDASGGAVHATSGETVHPTSGETAHPKPVATGGETVPDATAGAPGGAPAVSDLNCVSEA